MYTGVSDPYSRDHTNHAATCSYVTWSHVQVENYMRSSHFTSCNCYSITRINRAPIYRVPRYTGPQFPIFIQYPVIYPQSELHVLCTLSPTKWMTSSATSSLHDWAQLHEEPSFLPLPGTSTMLPSLDYPVPATWQRDGIMDSGAWYAVPTLPSGPSLKQ